MSLLHSRLNLETGRVLSRQRFRKSALVVGRKLEKHRPGSRCYSLELRKLSITPSTGRVKLGDGRHSAAKEADDCFDCWIDNAVGRSMAQASRATLETSRQTFSNKSTDALISMARLAKVGRFLLDETSRAEQPDLENLEKRTGRISVTSPALIYPLGG